MSRATINIGLIVLFLGSILLNSLGPANTSKRNIEYFPNMAHSVRRDAFSPNGVFPDGKTLQEPVPGTIPRGTHPLYYRATAEDALRAGQELLNPFSSARPGAVQRGTAIFANFCTPCHGVQGTGNGLVALRGFPAPPSLLAAHAVNMKDGQIFHILTYGQGNMPSYASQLTVEDRWKVILYVRSFQSKGPESSSAESLAQTGAKPAGAAAGSRP